MLRLSRTVPALALFGALCVAGATAQAAFPGSNGRIYHTQDRSGKGRLLATDQSGASTIRVGKVDRYDASQSSLSPNGKTIVFQSYRTGNSELYSVAANGRGAVTRLTRTAGLNELLPAWSPSGTRILFQAGRRNAVEQDLYTVNTRGRDRRRLTSSRGTDGNAEFSPDGRRIAFSTNRPGTDDYDLWLMNADGSKERALTRMPSAEGEPNWSPDGKQIAFTSAIFIAGSTASRDDIYKLALDGSPPVRLTDTPFSESTPAWSPDGRKIAFTSDRGGAGNFDLWTMSSVTGSALRQLTKTPYDEFHVSWPAKR